MIRVLLADDHLLIREALVLLLETEEGIEVVADVGRGDEAVEQARALRPDVAVLDIDMPGMDGLAAAERLSREVPSCRLIIVTAHGRPGNLRRAMAAGVRGFLGKDAPGSRLAEVIRQVAGGARYIDPQLAADALAAEECPLTPRELDALRAAADGSPISKIARSMGLSEGTVRNYLSAAVTKLGADNRHAAVRAARDRGWI
ncbi:MULTISPECIES: response regulator transcription factor [Thermomonospora]|mgnify:CR=1 FL=1|uniref:Two component transcriptional regulator, LuxR family n=1 Tax=Thermomonospora curvata (strain ATCC 19995 / DSM 43183 / JCM 3096 / KCTC 9072 / NBRC 15933 / NCIMB 10081 / Henssen B9) TaxID=471852 RepID=D1ABG4_THECD|nr:MULTISPECIES: response regulator transcription factor [Thermomonospora]ACY97200.1 two component transcriptional regulator, LuxR family [Thermomonospora curvata DSM 43183]PKK15055.1 MAG: DNA-binding response regulator [Thermomonospora sp. CIF 1]